jgi:rSAM/selenodomain-associated transferase 2
LCNWIVRSGLITPDNQPNEDVSIIVPVFNDTDALKELFIRLAAMHPAPAEVVVVDGGADNDCERLCMNYGAVYLRTEPNRGLQLRQGASATSNGILWFLHADSIPPIDAIQVIRRHLQKDYAGGYFRFRFDGPRHWYKRWLEHAINLRVRFGIPYGDQGLFVTKDTYFAAGGHTASPLFEEVKLVQNLRANEGFTEAAAAIDVSSRRWERDGWLRRSLHNRGLAVAFAIGVAPEKLAHHYGSKTRNISKSQDTRNA